MADKIKLDYLRKKTYTITPTQQIGTDADHEAIYPLSSPLRVAPTPAGDVAYVRKFGTAHTITDLTDLSDPAVANLAWTVKTADGLTTYGSRANGGAFTDGSTTGATTAIRLEASASGGAATLPASMTITDATFGALTVVLPAETIADGDTVIFYISAGGSSYYDILMKYGGARHTPVLGSSRYTYFHPYTAYEALNSTTDGVEIVDSESYAFPFYTGAAWVTGFNCDTATTYIYATVGQSPTIRATVGASIYSETISQHNNITSIYWNENGDAGGDGTWQNPFDTIANAAAARTTEAFLTYGGSGATATGGIITTSFTIADDYLIDSDYGYTPKFRLTTASTACLIVTVADTAIIGYIFDSPGTTSGINLQHDDFTIISNTFLNLFNSIYQGVVGNGDLGQNIFNNKIGNCSFGIWVDTPTSATGNIYNNLFYNCVNAAIYLFMDSLTTSLTIYNNIIYNCGKGIYLDYALCIIGDVIRNNTIYNSTTYACQFYESDTNTNTPTYRDLIIRESGSYDFYTTGQSPVVTYTCHENSTGFDVSSGTNTKSDPLLIKETLPYKLGIAPGSPCYRTGTSSDDMGAKLRLLEINANNIYIQGIIFDSGDFYNNFSYILDTADHIGHTTEYCNIKKFQGIANDFYDNNVDTDSNFLNNIIYSNGSGIYLPRGGNTLKHNLFISNDVYGLHINHASNILENDVFSNNRYGFYAASNYNGTISNCIFSNNTINGAYSVAAIEITYSCVDDNFTSLVDITDTNNVITPPLFFDTDDLNYTLKSIIKGSAYNSPCLNTDGNGQDMGAYQEDDIIAGDGYKMYQLQLDPDSGNLQKIIKGGVTLTDAVGRQRIIGQSHKRVFPLSWNADSYTYERQRKKLEYIAELCQTNENELDDDQTKLLVTPLPDTHMETGTGATVDATALTITDSAKDLIENEHKGWFINIIFDSDQSYSSPLTGVIDGTAKTLTVTGATWTVNEHTGRWLYYAYKWFYIVSNTADVLTVSDPYSYLANASGVAWEILYCFKIQKNDETIYTVSDPDGMLVSGTYDYYIDYMEMRIQRSDFEYAQAFGYDMTVEIDRTGYNVIFEEW